MKSPILVTTMCVTLVAQYVSAQTNPFLDLVDALTGEDSLFNGPDRSGADTLHGEEADHWFTDYQAIDLYDQDPNNDTWDDVGVPPWQDNTDPPVFVNPDEPVLPILRDPISGLYVVDGRFLVGAIKWPHEEYLEQYVDGTITEITDGEKVPVYWLAGYRLFIPPNYGSTLTPELAARRGKALIVQAGGQTPIPGSNRPPWMVPMLDGADWRQKAARDAALRLGVPVLMLGPNPVARNVFEENRSGLEQGGVAGYWGEARFDFSGHWSIKAPEADPIRDHPQFLYVASYIRARTFLEGFFNPAANGTTSWSKWDDITNNNTARYTPMTDVIVMAGSKRGHAACLATLADPYLTAFIANGAGNPRITEFNRLAMDEQWEMREARYLTGTDQYLNEMKAPGTGDDNQLRPASDMQSSVTHLDLVYSGQAAVQLPYYDLYPIFKDRDVMKDADHPNNPLPEIWAFVTQGLQDPFWPAQDWTYWMANEVFHGEHFNLDFHTGATHAPYHQDMADAIHGFCQAKWFERPMPTIRITRIEYVLPIQGETPTTIPLKVHAEAVIPTHANWTLEGDPVFRLCLGLRPLSDVTSRGMWSDVPREVNQVWEYGRQTPWWEIEPTTVVQNGTVYTLVFDAVSDAYAAVNPEESPYFPMGFDPPYGNGLDLDGIPPNFHVAICVRVAATHEQSGQERWPVRSSSVVELLPPWIEVPESQAFGWGDPEGLLDGDAEEE